MSDERTELPEGDELPREWLEEWTVPDVPRDLSARVMSRMHETPAVSPPLVFAQSRSSTVVATGAAVFAAAAAAAALVISVSRPPAAPEAPTPVPVAEAPVPTPVIVAGDMQMQALGHLVLDVAPGDAKVEIDGVELAGPAPFVATNLPAGKHELRVTRDGYKPWVKVLDVPAAELQLPITLVTESPHDKAVRESSEAGKAVGEMLKQQVAEDRAAAPGTPVPAADPLGRHVSPTKASVVGNLDADIIRRVVRAHINEVRTCYNAGLVRNASLEGRVAVQFTIGGEGTVTETQIVDTTISDKEVETCIAKAVERWKFPKPDGGGSVVVTYPFVLEAG